MVGGGDGGCAGANIQKKREITLLALCGEAMSEWV